MQWMDSTHVLYKHQHWYASLCLYQTPHHEILHKHLESNPLICGVCLWYWQFSIWELTVILRCLSSEMASSEKVSLENMLFYLPSIYSTHLLNRSKCYSCTRVCEANRILVVYIFDPGTSDVGSVPLSLKFLWHFLFPRYCSFSFQFLMW